MIQYHRFVLHLPYLGDTSCCVDVDFTPLGLLGVVGSFGFHFASSRASDRWA